jgi:hypothetical protein
MSFAFPVLLGGLVLLGVPVLLHLIMRQKPKHLLFPALRFLLERHRTNQRKLRLRHWLLLALRLLLVAAMCLALALPKVFTRRVTPGSDRPVALVLVFDTRPSMQYGVKREATPEETRLTGKKLVEETRLREAQRQALELIDGLQEGSKVAIFDTGEPGGDWLPALSVARTRVGELKIRPANSPVTSRLDEAYRLLADLDQEAATREEALPRFLYVFSDRTQESWDSQRAKDLQPWRDRLGGPLPAVFVDVGVDNPIDLALTAEELPRKAVPIHGKAAITVTVRATGADFNPVLVCRLDREEAVDRKSVELKAGQSKTVTFERSGLAPGFHQAEVTVEAADDTLPFNNALFTTFLVRGSRRILTLVDSIPDAYYWKLALQDAWEQVEPPGQGIQCDVKILPDARDLAPDELSKKYQAICLLNVAKPDSDLWERLEQYVNHGGGLAIVPPGQELSKDAYNKNEAAQRLLPARFDKILKAPAQPGVIWKDPAYQHPLLARFKEWKAHDDVDFDLFKPAADRYWEVTPLGGGASVLVKYADDKDRPALLERTFDRSQTRGRVLLFTTSLDKRHLHALPPWNDYIKSSFYLVLVNEAMGYLAGGAEQASLNYYSGQAPSVTFPATVSGPGFTLQGPGLSANEAAVIRGEGQAERTLPQAVTPGNYLLFDGQGKAMAAFSVNPAPEESQLGKVPAEQIEALFGPGSILTVQQKLDMHDALLTHWQQPWELFPYLMLLVLLALAVENLLANRFYKRETPTQESTTTVAAPS